MQFVYSSHTFTMRNYFTVLDFAAAVIPQRMNDITKLQLFLQVQNRRVEKSFERRFSLITGEEGTNAQRAFRIIASMQNLKVLRVEWEYQDYPGNHRRRIELLKPLCLVSPTEQFMVRAPWDWLPGGEELGDMPFVYEEVPEDEWVKLDMTDPVWSPDDREGVDPEGYEEDEGDLQEQVRNMRAALLGWGEY